MVVRTIYGNKPGEKDRKRRIDADLIELMLDWIERGYLFWSMGDEYFVTNGKFCCKYEFEVLPTARH